MKKPPYRWLLLFPGSVTGTVSISSVANRAVLNGKNFVMIPEMGSTHTQASPSGAGGAHELDGELTLRFVCPCFPLCDVQSHGGHPKAGQGFAGQAG